MALGFVQYLGFIVSFASNVDLGVSVKFPSISFFADSKEELLLPKIFATIEFVGFGVVVGEVGLSVGAPKKLSSGGGTEGLGGGDSGDIGRGFEGEELLLFIVGDVGRGLEMVDMEDMSTFPTCFRGESGRAGVQFIWCGFEMLVVGDEGG